MKNFILIILAVVFFISSQARADINLSQLAGAWKLNCTQSQSSSHQGYMIETYTFSTSGTYQLVRQWFSDSACATTTTTESENGSISFGNQDTNNGFNPAGTFDTKYITASGTELGLMWVDSTYTHMRIARGFGTTQNTMLGLFQYTKQ